MDRLNWHGKNQDHSQRKRRAKLKWDEIGISLPCDTKNADVMKELNIDIDAGKYSIGKVETFIMPTSYKMTNIRA